MYIERKRFAIHGKNDFVEKDEDFISIKYLTRYRTENID